MQGYTGKKTWNLNPKERITGNKGLVRVGEIVFRGKIITIGYPLIKCSTLKAYVQLKYTDWRWLIENHSICLISVYLLPQTLMFEC